MIWTPINGFEVRKKITQQKNITAGIQQELWMRKCFKVHEKKKKTVN